MRRRERKGRSGEQSRKDNRRRGGEKLGGGMRE